MGRIDSVEVAAVKALQERERPTEAISFRISKTDFTLLEKLVEIKGGSVTGIFREALHLLFATYGMLPEESTRLLLGRFVNTANKAQLDSSGKPRTGT